MRVSIRCLFVIALIAALSAFGATTGFAQGNGNGNSDHGCVTGNPSQGSECNGGPNDNQGKPGGGVGCSGGSNADRTEPCGRGNGDGTLNTGGNVPGCTSHGNAVNKNPHCGTGNEPPPPCEVNCGPPPPGGCVTNCGNTPPSGGVVVNTLPSTGTGAFVGHQGGSLLALLLAAVTFLAAGIRIQRRQIS